MPQSPDHHRLSLLIAEALDLADALRLDRVGIDLNGALVALTGAGKPPVDVPLAA